MWTSLWTSPKERMRLESIQFLPSKKKKNQFHMILEINHGILYVYK